MTQQFLHDAAGAQESQQAPHVLCPGLLTSSAIRSHEKQDQAAGHVSYRHVLQGRRPARPNCCTDQQAGSNA